MEKGGHTYMTMNKNKTVIYTGSSSDLITRIPKHKEKAFPGFTAKYNADILVWYEFHPSIEEAIARERQLKNWKREWKLDLIREMNPDFEDLYPKLLREEERPSKSSGDTPI